MGAVPIAETAFDFTRAREAMAAAVEVESSIPVVINGVKLTVLPDDSVAALVVLYETFADARIKSWRERGLKLAAWPL